MSPRWSPKGPSLSQFKSPQRIWWSTIHKNTPMDARSSIKRQRPDHVREHRDNKTAHYNDVIMSVMASQITSLTIVYSTVYSKRRTKKTSKLRTIGLCEGNSPVTGEFEGNSPVTGEFPAQRASNAENVSIWWRHHEWPPGNIPHHYQLNYMSHQCTFSVKSVIFCKVVRYCFFYAIDNYAIMQVPQICAIYLHAISSDINPFIWNV